MRAYFSRLPVLALHPTLDSLNKKRGGASSAGVIVMGHKPWVDKVSLNKPQVSLVFGLTSPVEAHPVAMHFHQLFRLGAAWVAPLP